MLTRYDSRFIRNDPESGEPLGVCDRTGFVFNRCDLHKQMEWRGNNLVWTGILVGEPFLDQPSQQNRPPLVKADPEAIKDPRPPTPYYNPDYNPAPNYKVAEEQLKKLRFT